MTSASRLAGVLLLLGVVHHACGQQNRSRHLLANLSSEREAVYIGEEFEVVLHVHSINIRVGKTFELDIPDDAAFALLSTGELPIRRYERATHVEEERRFRCRLRAVKTGPQRFAPGLQLGILTRNHTFFGPSWQENVHDVQVNAIEVEVRDLPLEAQPEDFSGAVGSFEWTVTLDPPQVAVGDIVKLVMTVTGSGRLEAINLAGLPALDHFRVYPAHRSESAPPGSVTFEQVLIPTDVKATRIPPVRFSYFDPRLEKYVSLSEGPFSLTLSEKAAPALDIYRPENGTNTQTATGTGSVPASPGRPAGVLARAMRRFRALQRGTLRAQAITLEAGTQGYLAPSRDALPTLGLPAGASVRILERWRGWLRIDHDGDRAWVPHSPIQ